MLHTKDRQTKNERCCDWCFQTHTHTQCSSTSKMPSLPSYLQPQNHLFISEALSVDPKHKVVEAMSEGVRFSVAYDKLVISTGSQVRFAWLFSSYTNAFCSNTSQQSNAAPSLHEQGSTFGIPGVHEHTYFLRDLHDVSLLCLCSLKESCLRSVGRKEADKTNTP